MRKYEKPEILVKNVSVDVCTGSNPDPFGVQSKDYDARDYWNDQVGS